MKVKTKTIKKSVSKKTQNKSFAVGTHEGQVFASVPYTSQDVKNSVLIVSVLVNVFLLTTWIITQVSQDYAVAVAQALL